MLPPEEQEHQIKNLMAMALISRVDVMVLLTAVEEVCRTLGQSTIEGLTFSEWFQKNRVLALEHELIGIENSDPALAAMLLNQIDTIKKTGGISGPEEQE